MRLMSDTIIRVLPLGDRTEFWLMNRPDQGWASRGYYYTSLDALLAAWAITLGAQGWDRHSYYIRAYAEVRGATGAS
jgi:hypothetical protein